MSVDLLDRHQVTDGVDHPPDLGAVLLDDHVADPLQAERAQRVALVLLAADRGLGLLDLEGRSHQDVTSARALSSAAGATSSTGRPRRAATASGSSRPLRASTVACTMLIWFDEPSDLLSTSWIPAHSSTARTGPPAITPVPAAAGRRSTTPAAASPCTGCGMVLPTRGTRKKLRLASSTPFEMARGTSRALPYPTPTTPLPSPTTTRAVKLKRRPPLTTFDTRLMVTTRSRNWLLSASREPRSRFGLRSRPPRRGSRSRSGAASVAAAASGAAVSAVTATSVSLISLTGSVPLRGRRRRSPRHGPRSGCHRGRTRRLRRLRPSHARRRARRACAPWRSCHRRIHAGPLRGWMPMPGCDPWRRR